MATSLTICVPRESFGQQDPSSLPSEAHLAWVWHALKSLNLNPLQFVCKATILQSVANQVFVIIASTKELSELRTWLSSRQINIFVSGVVGPIPSACDTILQDVFQLACPSVTIKPGKTVKSASFFVPESDLPLLLAMPALIPGHRLRYRQHMVDRTLKDITTGSSSSSRANSSRSSPIASPIASQTLVSRSVSHTQSKSLSNIENLSTLPEIKRSPVSEPESESESVSGDTESESDTQETPDQPPISNETILQQPAVPKPVLTDSRPPESDVVQQAINKWRLDWENSKQQRDLDMKQLKESIKASILPSIIESLTSTLLNQGSLST